MKSTELIKENNTLREQLSPENKQFYEDLLILVRTKSLFRKEEVYEAALLGILQDLLDAQTAGQTAEEYLGHDIHSLADEIVAEFPKETAQRSILFILSLLGIYLCVVLFNQLLLPLIFSPTHSANLSLAGLLISSLYTALLVALLFKSFSFSRLALQISHESYFKAWLKLIIPCSLVIAGYVLILYLTQHIWVWTIHF